MNDHLFNSTPVSGRDSRPNYWILAAVIAFPALLRMLGQPWNLTPVGGIALFAGAHFRDKRWAIAIPLSAMMLSDLTLGLMKGDVFTYTFHALVPVVYGCYVLYAMLGSGVRSHWDRAARSSETKTVSDLRKLLTSVCPLGIAAISGSLAFFAITNFGSWMMYDTYPKTLAGLIGCYVAGLPFLRPTLVGDAVYVSLFFGAYAVVRAAITNPATNRYSLDN